MLPGLAPPATGEIPLDTVGVSGSVERGSAGIGFFSSIKSPQTVQEPCHAGMPFLNRVFCAFLVVQLTGQRILLVCPRKLSRGTRLIRRRPLASRFHLWSFHGIGYRSSFNCRPRRRHEQAKAEISAVAQHHRAPNLSGELLT